MCKISIASLRRLPSHQSPLISQVLFGEFVQIISKKKNWFRIKCNWDDSIGWIDPKQFYVLKLKDLKLMKPCSYFALEHLHGLIAKEFTLPISIGSDLINYDGLNLKLPIGSFQYNGQIFKSGVDTEYRKLINGLAKKFIHCPYLKGGRSILGVDAGGMLQLIFKMLGHHLPRNVEAQAELGDDVGFINQVRIGDLAFFQSEQNRIIHAGLVLEENLILHPHGMVRIDLLDQQGIYDRKAKKYLFTLRTIRRIVTVE